jgi:HK97 gp10 family phage protein
MIVTGLTEVLAGFLGEIATVDGHAKEATKETAERIEATAKSLAPKLTGALAASITTDPTVTGAEVGPTARYAPFVEYGTWKDAPQPFMGPAAEAHEDDLAKFLEDRVGEL